MDLQSFIHRLTEVFEDTDPERIKPQANFREIEGYSSLVAFLIMGMANDEYNVNLTAGDMRKSNTIEDIYSIIKSKIQN